MVPPAPQLSLERLRANVAGIRARIEAARARGPHAAATVDLVAVTKSMPAPIFRALAAVGETAVGENRAPAARERRRGAPAGLTWHGIGHLQRNKVRPALEAFDVFHALDSVRLAERLERLLAESGRRWPVYLEVNASGEAAKGGFRPEEARQALADVARCPHLEVLGWMTLASHGAPERDLRSSFRTLRDVRDDAVRRGVGALPPAGLSMGMSSDFEVAVEEGATVVRVGRALFHGVSKGGLPSHGGSSA